MVHSVSSTSEYSNTTSMNFLALRFYDSQEGKGKEYLRKIFGICSWDE